MAKFCGKCGNKIDINEKFCPQCGMAAGEIIKEEKVLSTSPHIGNVTKEKPFNTEHRSKKLVFKCIMAFVMVAGISGGGFYYYQKAQEKEVSMEAIAPIEVVESASDEKNIQGEKDNENQLIKTTQQILVDKKIAGNVVGTSLGHNNDGTLALIKSGDEFKFIIINNIDNMVAEVPFSTKAYSLGQSTDETIIFDMTVYNDTKGKDRENGIWNGNNHLIPVYALYKVEGNNVVPGMLTTGWGAKPSHYQGYFYEQKNVNIANLFLTEMKALRSNCLSNNVIVPSK